MVRALNERARRSMTGVQAASGDMAPQDSAPHLSDVTAEGKSPEEDHRSVGDKDAVGARSLSHDGACVQIDRDDRGRRGEAALLRDGHERVPASDNYRRPRYPVVVTASNACRTEFPPAPTT